MRSFKTITAPRIAYGSESGGPSPIHYDPRHTIGLALSIGSGEPSKAIRPVVHIDRRCTHVTVRVWFANMDGTLWASPGYAKLTWPRFLVLKARSAWRRWREPVPAARVVQR